MMVFTCGTLKTIFFPGFVTNQKNWNTRNKTSQYKVKKIALSQFLSRIGYLADWTTPSAHA
jgi:hypothetical protein